ncbi:septum site-determining protein MinC [Nostoc sp. 'Peltigera membranacea cyanobiont' 213]|uniref:septum site-determining protein MinC n=1 Tax=Nostoc cyanobionts TaxID=3123326 RepID=UPI000B9510E4|nr:MULTISPECIES: septum site-determining protein MinC [unclassified Nostoc]AVH65267.1 septum formation inhibitor protein MinC [Nostoc sp. 'Peltigera membranacea cyanobiont' N6]OYD87853.1 septum site-determining protein MinC [Nostoc sp. 'Peltigera membranacea cyanobiont' 213]
MTSDPTIPNLKSNSALPNAESNSLISGVEVNPTVSDVESDPIPPDAELKSVLLYLKSNPVLEDVESNPANPDVELSTDAASDDFILTDSNPNESAVSGYRVNDNTQVQLKSKEGRLLLILPLEAQVSASELSWSDIWQQIRQRLNAGDRFRIANTPVHLMAQDRLVDARQLQELAEALSEVQLRLISVSTSRRQTAIAAVTSGYSVEQLQPITSLNTEPEATATPQADALYLETTVRSGVEIRHPGTVIILGDVNPGGIVIADGDIIIWGRLRGIAHAGAGGNRECLIMALQMEPTQLRIADAVARAPEKLPMQFSPEVAHIMPQGIRIARASDFSRNQFTKSN